MISLSATSYDPLGLLIVSSRLKNPYHGQRRGSVTATLDLGVSVFDGGYTDADQTLSATIQHPSRAMLETLQYLTAYYSQIIVCCETGAFLAVPSFAVNNETLSISLRVIARLDN